MRKVSGVVLLLIAVSGLAVGQDTPQQLGKMVCEAANAKDLEAYRELVHPKMFDTETGKGLVEKRFKKLIGFSPFPIDTMKFKTMDLEPSNPWFRFVRFHVRPQKEVKAIYHYKRGPRSYGSKGTGILLTKHEGQWRVVLGEPKKRPVPGRRAAPRPQRPATAPEGSVPQRADSPEALAKSLVTASRKNDYEAYLQLVHPESRRRAADEMLKREFERFRKRTFPERGPDVMLGPVTETHLKFFQFHVEPRKLVSPWYAKRRDDGSKETGTVAFFAAPHEGQWRMVLGEPKKRPKKGK